jgi:DNA-binding CsgD family transcriptional regulator
MRRGNERWPGPRLRVTARESEVLNWVAAGKSDWAIGRILNISQKTVNFHVENAKRKLGVGTRVQAIVVAIRDGIIG